MTSKDKAKSFEEVINYLDDRYPKWNFSRKPYEKYYAVKQYYHTFPDDSCSFCRIPIYKVPTTKIITVVYFENYCDVFIDFAMAYRIYKKDGKLPDSFIEDVSNETICDNLRIGKTKYEF